MTTPDRLHVDARGFSLAALRWGPASGRPIVLVHGFLDQCLGWEAVAEHLVAACDRPVIAIDQRGHGLSDHVGPGGAYHIWDMVADLAAVLRHEADRTGQTPDLVGHSMGGTVSSLCAATAPEALRRLVLVEGLGPPDILPLAIPRATDFVAFRHVPRRHPAFATVDEAAARLLAVDPTLDPPLAHRLADRVLRPVVPDDPQVREGASGALTWTWDAHHRARNPYPFSAALHRRFLTAIPHPALVVTAEHGFLPDDHDARRDALPDAHEVVVPDSHHMVHRQRPRVLADLITGHVRT